MSFSREEKLLRILNLGKMSESASTNNNRTTNNNNTDNHEMSRVLKKKTASDFYFLQQYYKYIIGLAILVSIPIIIMSAFWSDIQGKNDMYQDPADSWQACLTQADYQVVPLKEISALSSAKLKTQFTNCLLAQNCSTPCLLGIAGTCAKILSGGSTVSDLKLQNGRFLNSLGYIGIQNVIFALISHGNMWKALNNPSWLISACGMMIWFCFSIFTYYSVSPVMPVPTQTNATFMTFLYYEGSYSKFRAFNDGDNKCLTAYRYVWVYLAFQIVLAATIFAGLIVGLYAERIRYKSPNRKHYDHLDYTRAPRAFGILGISFYLIFAVSKMVTSYTELNAINDYTATIQEAAASGHAVWFPRIWFPFAVPAVDLTTLLGISSCISVLRGFTVQSVSAFQIAGATAAVYAFSGWPMIVGGYEFYFHNNFDNFDTCYNYFLTYRKLLVIDTAIYDTLINYELLFCSHQL